MQIIGTMWARGEGSTMNRKNARKILGKPMIHWALKNALDAGFIDDIFVFTEDNEIAACTKELGCHVIERPREMLFYNGGFSMPSEWGEYFNNKIIDKIGSTGDIVVSLNCNICLLTGETLRRMYVRLMEDELAGTVFPVVEIEPHLYMENPNTGYLFPIWEDPGLDRQKFPKIYRRLGVSIDHKIRQAQSAFVKRLHHVVPFEESIDVHCEEDIMIAELLLGKRIK